MPLAQESIARCAPSRGPDVNQAGQRVAVYQIMISDGTNIASTVTYLLAMVAIVLGVLVFSSLVLLWAWPG